MKFSVIIPVYNVAPYLRECLSSVVKATEQVKKRGGGGQRRGSPLVEVICVDDGSTDGSGAILDEYVEKMDKDSAVHLHLFSPPRFRVIHQPNRGEGGARNAGLDVASGDYLAFVDADDILAPTALADAMELIAKHPDATFVALGLQKLSETVTDAGRGRVDVLTSADGIPRRLVMTSCVQMVLRRDRVGDLRFPRYAMGADRVYVYRVARRAKKIVLSDKIAYRYRVHGTSASHSHLTLRKRWDDFRHAVHVLGILLVTPNADLRLRLSYARLSAVKLLALVREGR